MRFLAFFSFCVFMFFSSAGYADENIRKDFAVADKEYVILLHGIIRSKTDMMPMTLYLRQKGYQASSLQYPSTKLSIEEIADHVHEQIQGLEDLTPEHTLHFVTHSMGGLVTRYYLSKYNPPNLGKVVMLGPPNTGSEFADFMKENEILSPMFKTIFGPAGQQLDTKQTHVNLEIDFPLGVIAGNKSINPLAPWVLKAYGKDHDGMVPVERTKIEGMSDHVVVPATHSFMMFTPKVMEQTHKFLQTGAFGKP